MMKKIFPVLLLFFSGCFYIGQEQYEDVLRKSSDQWSSREALTVLISPMGHNFNDPRTNIKIMATPYYPSVILAIQRNAQRLHHWTEEEFRSNTDALAKDALGLSVNWRDNRFVDSHGDYFRNELQIDSLMFLITIDNRAWPCNSMVAFFTTGNIYSTTGQSSPPIMMPVVSPENCYTPDITELEQQIYLVNSRGYYIKPKFVWGKRHNILTVDETLFAMFQVREGSYHFFRGSEKVSLVVKGFEKDIILDFPLSRAR